MHTKSILEVRITIECLQKVANDTLQFFECTMNQFDHTIQELYNKNDLKCESINNINHIGNTNIFCFEYPTDDGKILLIKSENIPILSNSVTETQTLFSVFDDLDTETLEYY